VKQFQISEEDLQSLEHILPAVLWKLTCRPDADPQDRVHFRQVRGILTNVRWGYWPPENVEIIPPGETDHAAE
jgi:hypothetical protein